jgi:hypothetical protein
MCPIHFCAKDIFTVQQIIIFGIHKLIVAKIKCVYKQETNRDSSPKEKLENLWSAYSF